MKRFTFFMISLFAFTALTAQYKVSDYGDYNPRFNDVQIRSTEDACTESVPSNAFETGYSSSSSLDFRSAADLVVDANDTYSLSQVVLYVFSFSDITSVDLYFYDDNAGLPGTVIGNAMGMTPTSTTIVGSNFGYDIYQVVLDLATPFDFVAGADITHFWIMPVVTNVDGDNNYLEVTSADMFGGTPVARSEDAGATWALDVENFEMVYEFNGDCGGVPYFPPTGCTYYQDFEGTELPADWSTEIVEGTADWAFGSNDAPTGDDFYSNAAIFDDDAQGSGAVNHVILYSPVFDLEDTNSTYAEFSVLVGFQEYGDQMFTIEVFDGTDWVVLDTFDEDLDPDLQTKSYDVTAYINSALQIRFNYDDLGEWGWYAGIDDFCMKYDEAPDNDCPGGAITIACGDSVSGDTTNATICEAVEDCDEYPNNPTTSPGVWYFIEGDGHYYTFSTCDTADYDTSIGVYTGDPGSLTCMVANDDGDGCGGYTSLLENVYLEDGVGYYIRVYGWSSSSVGAFTLNVDCNIGVEDNAIAGFVMNPNPVKDILNLRADSNIEHVSIFNMLGQKVLEVAPSTTATQIDMSHLDSGAYIVKVQAGNQTGSYNLIKE